MAKKQTGENAKTLSPREAKALLDELASGSPVPIQAKKAKPSRKNAKAPKSKPEAPVGGKLSTREQARSKAKPKKS